MKLLLRLGEKVDLKGRGLTVTELDVATLGKVRSYLTDIAAAGTTVTYGELINDLNLPYVPNGLGRILDLLSEDCIRRHEPSLAALVVAQSIGEVGNAFEGDPEMERELLYDFWEGGT
ncbi:hypothetical protein [Rhodococcus koreensis]